MAQPHTYKIVVIPGSVRPGNYTSKAVALLADEFGQRPTVALEILDPTGMELPLPGQPATTADAQHLQDRVSEADGVILVTPEYHGSFSCVMKLIIDNLGFPSSLKGKPVALLGVAAGRIGAIKALEHLRSVASHVGAIVLPGPVSVAGVRGIFDANGNCTDENVEKMIRGLAPELLDHIARCETPPVCLEEMVRAGSV